MSNLYLFPIKKDNANNNNNEIDKYENERTLNDTESQLIVYRQELQERNEKKNNFDK